MNLQPYSFCFLRYVHDPLAAEFANVGVVLWAPNSRYLGFRFSTKFRRLSRFFQNFESGDYRQLINRIATRFEQLQSELANEDQGLPFDKEPEHARDLAFQVIPQDDNALQWSMSAGGVTDSPEAELDALYEEAVGRHYDSEVRSRRDDAHVFRHVYSQAFEAPEVKPHISEHLVEAPLTSYKFDYAWKNGVWNVYQPLSFDLKRPEDIHEKAFKWESRSRYLRQSDDNPDIHLLLGSPSDPKASRAYGRAKDVLHASGEINIIEENEASDFARQLISEVKAVS